MLVKSVSAGNNKGQLLEIPLEDSGIGFYIRDIKGLDPVKATLVSSSFANMDGEQYHSSRRDTRNLVITLGFDPDYGVQGVEELRKQLYQYFLPKSEVTLTFLLFDKFSDNILTRNLSVDIVGNVETFDAPLFTDDPQATISIMCWNPDFYDPLTQIFDSMSVSDFTDETLTYVGTTDTGVVFTFSPDRDVSEFTIYHRPPDQTLRTVDFQLALVAGDLVTISSVRGNKFATLLHAGNESSVLYAISPQSAWLELQEGDNSIRVYADGDPIPYEIQYLNKYGGL